MKKFITIILSLLIICSCVVPVFSASPKISVKAPNAVIGETITVSVNLSANSNLGGLQFNVRYDTSCFQLVSGSAKESSLFMATINDGTSGIISYAGATASSVNSSGSLLTFKLKVLKTGGKISVSVVDAIDGNEKDATSTVSASGATVKCSHKNAQWTVTKKATCTEKGVETLKCSCGHTATREIKMTEHTYKWTVQKEATETETGLKVAECTVCGNKKEQAIPMLTTTTTLAEVDSTEAENTTPSTSTPSSDSVEVAPEKDISIPKVVAITVCSVLGIEALGLLIFFLVKKKKKSE